MGEGISGKIEQSNFDAEKVSAGITERLSAWRATWASPKQGHFKILRHSGSSYLNRNQIEAERPSQEARQALVDFCAKSIVSATLLGSGSVAVELVDGKIRVSTELTGFEKDAAELIVDIFKKVVNLISANQLDLPAKSARIIELSPDNWRQLQDLKLRSLQDEPVAFEDPVVGEDKYAFREESEWREILSGKMSGGKMGESVHVFAESGEGLVGMVSAVIPNPREGAGKIATIQHMYVDAARRGEHIGQRLFADLLAKLKARGDLEKIELQVVATQLPAVEMYKSFGFVEVGKKKFERGGKEYEELEMEVDLRSLR